MSRGCCHHLSNECKPRSEPWRTGHKSKENRQNQAWILYEKGTEGVANVDEAGNEEEDDEEEGAVEREEEEGKASIGGAMGSMEANVEEAAA